MTPWPWLASALLCGVGFTDVTTEVGLVHQQHVPRLPPDCLIPAGLGGPLCETERSTGGVAVADYDGNGWPDIYFTRLDGPDRLFANVGGTFVDVTAQTGLDHDLSTNGAAWFDADNDGDADLYVTGIHNRNQLFINDDGWFVEAGVERGAVTDDGLHHGGTGIAVGDVDRDGWLDVYVTEWAPLPSSCGTTHTRLFHNRGAAAPGYFEDVTYAAGAGLVADTDAPNTLYAYGFAPALVDMDDDGWLDLLVAADFGTSRLLWNRRDGTFVDGTAAAGVGTEENGMGSALGDFDGDGDLDWFVSSIFDPAPCPPGSVGCNGTGNRLYRNLGNRRFDDVTDEAGVRDGGFGWGAVFLDADHDGDLDLALTNGMAPTDGFEDDPTRLWENRGGTFMEIAVSSGIIDRGQGKALVTLDHDRDGDLDLLVTQNGGSPILYRNDVDDGGDWLAVTATGRSSNRDGLGVSVRIEGAGSGLQVRHIGAGAHFLGHGERVAHFGLGTNAGPLRVTATWPGRAPIVMDGVSPNQRLHLTEPDLPPVGATVSHPQPRDCDGNGLADICEGSRPACPPDRDPLTTGPAPERGCRVHVERTSGALGWLLVVTAAGRRRRNQKEGRRSR